MLCKHVNFVILELHSLVV